MRRGFWVDALCSGALSLLLFISPSAAFAAPPPLPPAWASVQPLLEDRCYDCHGEIKTKGNVDLKKLEGDPKVLAEYPLWEKVQETVSQGKMPPKKADPLTPAEKSQLLAWVSRSLDLAANQNAGDPGPVTMCRLTNAEYDNTIRDLTGFDLGLAREFPADGGGGEGFSNIGDVLFVSPQQLDKYLASARKLADQASILPGTGIVFHAQHIGLRGPEQMKAQAEQALYVWYQHKAEPYLPKDDEDLREADYMLACWKYQHRDLTGAASLDTLAKDMGLSAAFLQNWWNLLNSPKPESRFLDLTRVPWRELPGPDAASPKSPPPAVLAALKAIQDQRRSWYEAPKNQSSVQRQQQDADGLRTYHVEMKVSGRPQVYVCIGDCGDGPRGDLALVSEMQVWVGKGPVSYPAFLRSRLQTDREALKKLIAQTPSPASPLPQQKPANGAPDGEAELQRLITEAETLLAQFGKHPLNHPLDANTLAIAAPRVLKLPLPKGAYRFKAAFRLDETTPDAEFATIQWRLATDNPPDVTKIMPGVLTIWKRQTQTSRQTMHDFEQMEAVFPDVYERRLEEVARNYYRRSPGSGVYYYSDEQLAGLLSAKDKEDLRRMKIDWGYTAPAKLYPKLAGKWDQLVIGHLKEFAARAWRRPLDPSEEAQLATLYADGVAKSLDRESAAREVLVRLLVSPNFLFKAETLPAVAGASPAAKAGDDLPLTAWELASRLSYFLWASMPDAPLRAAAADGSLLQPNVLRLQTQRMLRDTKASAMAKEFMGQWLQFDGFASHSGVDTAKFPQFTPELRQDLYQETLTFFTHLIRDDRPVGEIVGADYTYLNGRLAKFYGIPDEALAGKPQDGEQKPSAADDEFRKVNVSAYHRGGLLGMGSVLTKTSRPHRTSPVLRGNWLLQVVLGIPVPPPPNNVPKLKEGGPKPATVREMLQQHRADPACAGCHARIDPLGFALENFDPIGRYRTRDESGLEIDDSAQIKDGPSFSGLEGLRQFLHTRENQITAQFCRKLLGYALGRQILPTDKALLARMQRELQANGGKFSSAVLSVVNSRQFLNRRYEPSVASNP